MSPSSAKRAAPPPNQQYGKPATPEQLQRASAHLKEHGIGAEIVADGAAALRTVLSMIPEGSEVFAATSETLAKIGLVKEIEDSEKFVSIRKRMMALDRSTETRELRRLEQAPPYVVGSVHAVTEEGDLLIASMTGSQLGAYAHGAGKVIWVAGAQKVVPTIEVGMSRLREYAYPLEDARALKAYGVNSGLNKILIISREVQPGRATVVLVQEALGF